MCNDHRVCFCVKKENLNISNFEKNESLRIYAKIDTVLL